MADRQNVATQVSLSEPDQRTGAPPGPPTFPVKPGDWVVRRDDPGCVAKVKGVYRIGGQVLVDLVLYARSGDKIGRESPAMGGPRTFEPACDYGNWRRISQPAFPIELKWLPGEDGRRVARFHHGGSELPDIEWAPAPRRSGGSGRKSDYDPQFEAAARRMAAQELRDVARTSGEKGLIARAEALEREAAQISRR